MTIFKILPIPKKESTKKRNFKFSKNLKANPFGKIQRGACLKYRKACFVTRR